MNAALSVVIVLREFMALAADELKMLLKNTKGSRFYETQCSLFFHSIENNKTVGLSVLRNAVYMHFAWASAHNGKWGQLTPLEKWMKN